MGLINPPPLRDDGRRLYEAGSLARALEAFERADSDAPLPPSELMLTAFAAYLLGREEHSLGLLGRAFRESLAAHDAAAAARAAYWLSFVHDTRRETAPAEAWGRRLAGLVDETGLTAEQGMVLSGRGHRALYSPDPNETRHALELSRESIAIARPAGDTDTEVFSRLTAGWALIRLGDRTGGLDELDEAMATVISQETHTPIVDGTAYCTVISASLHTADLPRAHAWTAASHQWCERNPEAVPFRGECLVHRSVMRMLDGQWREAYSEVEQALARLHPKDEGYAYYQLGELHRLAGRFAASEDAYRLANAAGRRPEPGVLLLKLAQGRTEAAAVAARRLSSELRPGGQRAEFLPAYVEAMAAAGDAEAARAGAQEIARLVEQVEQAEGPGSPRAVLPRARALTAEAITCLAVGEHAEAARSFRDASMAWHALGMPYPEARARAALGHCYAALGDDDAAALEFDAARAAFTRLGADPDLAGLPDGTGTGGPARPAGRAPSSATPLTAREVEVVRLAAAGLTNRAIARELVLSEKTVARHLANIYGKLGIASRAAATAYAYRNGLV